MNKIQKSLRLVLVLLIICATAVSMFGCSETPVSVGTNPTLSGNSPTESKDPVFKVGEIVELGDTVISLISVTENEGSTYVMPAEGNVFILCEFEISNNSSADLTISSMLNFEAYCDDYVCNYSISALMQKGDKSQLDGTIAAGKKMKGVIGYEVPQDWKELEVHFTSDILSSKEVVFVATND